MPLEALKTFKVFRKTTRFKKFNRGVTLMVRKKYAKRKYKTTWLFLTYTTQAWTSHYLKSRQFERFYQSLGLFNAKAHSADYDVFRVSTVGFGNEIGINIFSCSWGIAKHHLNLRSPLHAAIQTRLVKDSKLSYVQASSLTDLSRSDSAYPLATNYDNILYHPHTETVEPKVYSQLLMDLGATSFLYSSHYAVVFRRWITWLASRWRAQQTAWINVICRTHWSSISW
jgi:hypothetical protein